VSISPWPGDNDNVISLPFGPVNPSESSWQLFIRPASSLFAICRLRARYDLPTSLITTRPAAWMERSGVRYTPKRPNRTSLKGRRIIRHLYGRISGTQLRRWQLTFSNFGAFRANGSTELSNKTTFYVIRWNIYIYRVEKNNDQLNMYNRPNFIEMFVLCVAKLDYVNF